MVCQGLCGNSKTYWTNLRDVSKSTPDPTCDSSLFAIGWYETALQTLANSMYPETEKTVLCPEGCDCDTSEKPDEQVNEVVISGTWTNPADGCIHRYSGRIDVITEFEGKCVPSAKTMSKLEIPLDKNGTVLVTYDLRLLALKEDIISLIHERLQTIDKKLKQEKV